MKNKEKALVLECLEYCLEQIENNGGEILPDVYPPDLLDIIESLKTK